MRIGWIGGLGRNEGELQRIAERAGHTLEFHEGHMKGRGADDLRSIVRRSDFVIVVTDVNSHGAAILARRLAHQLGRGCMVVSKLGFSRFQALLDAFAVRDERLRAAV
jgi:hypothetical protein